MEILTSPPAVYYPNETRTMFTSVFYALLIALHVLSILLAVLFIFYFRLKLMILVIELCNTVTILYLYGALGLFRVSELAS